MSQESDLSKTPVPVVHTEPSIETLRAGLKKHRDRMEERQKKYLEILKGMEKKDKKSAWLFAQTMIAYDELRLLYEYVDGLWNGFGYQISLNQHIAERLEGLRGEHEHFKREEMPIHFDEAFKKGFETLAKSLAQSEKATESYVA